MIDRQEEDPALLERLRAGDRDALAELFDLHRERLRRMVQFRLHPRIANRLDVDDVLQDCWLDAVKRIDSYREQRDPSGYLWLRLVLGQTMIDLYRKHVGAQMRNAKQEVSMNRFAGPSMGSDAISMHLSASITSPSHAAQRAELVQVLRKTLDDLDEIDREILVLRHLEELSNLEVAAVLEIQPSAASNRYVRALARLKGLLGSRAGISEPAAPRPRNDA